MAANLAERTRPVLHHLDMQIPNRRFDTPVLPVLIRICHFGIWDVQDCDVGVVPTLFHIRVHDNRSRTRGRVPAHLVVEMIEAECAQLAVQCFGLFVYLAACTDKSQAVLPVGIGIGYAGIMCDGAILCGPPFEFGWLVLAGRDLVLSTFQDICVYPVAKLAGESEQR